jgi:hypothetical protein
MKKFKNEVVNGYNNKPIVWNIDGKQQELKLVNIMWIILNSFNMQTQKDSIEGAKVANVLDEVVKDEKDIIELEDTTHYWFYQVAEKLTPSVFKINGNAVYLEIKDGWIKEEPTIKKGR